MTSANYVPDFDTLVDKITVRLFRDVVRRFILLHPETLVEACTVAPWLVPEIEKEKGKELQKIKEEKAAGRKRPHHLDKIIEC